MFERRGCPPAALFACQVEPGSEAKVSENVYKLDNVFDGGHATSAVYEKTTQHLIRQVRGGQFCE